MFSTCAFFVHVVSWPLTSLFPSCFRCLLFLQARQPFREGIFVVSIQVSWLYSRCQMSLSCCCSVAQSCLILCDPMDHSTPGFPVLHHFLELLKLVSIESVMPFNYLILFHPLLLLPSVLPSIKVFSSELTLRIRWPEYWSFSISPSNECLLGWVILQINISTKIFYNFKIIKIL